MLRTKASGFNTIACFQQGIADAVRICHARFSALRATASPLTRSDLRTDLVVELRKAVGFREDEARDQHLLFGKAGGLLNRDLWFARDILIPRHPSGLLRSPEDMADFLLRRVPPAALIGLHAHASSPLGNI